MTREELYGHYQTYYAPNNATVVAVGDFDTAYLLKRVQETFGQLPRRDGIPAMTAEEPEQEGERRVMVRRPGPTASLQIAYHTPAADHPDIYPLTIADALLSGAKAMGMGGGGGRSARLYKALVQTDLAAGAGSYFRLTRDPHLFQFSATAKPGAPWEESLAKIEAALYAEVERLANEPPSAAEMEKTIRQARAGFVYASEGTTGLAYLFGWLETIASADYYSQFLDRLAAVTPADVQRVVRTYLRPENRTVGWFIPQTSDTPVSDPE
jgi:zinc protease